MTFDAVDKIEAAIRSGEMLSPIELSPGQASEARLHMLNQLERNPIFIQYKQHISHNHKVYNDQPWHALGERYYAVYTCLAASISDRVGLEGLKEGVSRESLMVSMAYMLSYTTPYLWNCDMEHLADAAPLPTHVVSHQVMPSPFMFWSRDSAYVQRDEQGNHMGENNWIALFYSHDHLLVLGDWVNESTDSITLVHNRIELGKTWPHDYEGDTQIGRLLKRCAFLSSPYVDTTKHRLAHHHRRQMEHAHIPAPEREETIHVVKLRHKAPAKAQPSGEPGAGVEWKHQWWVAAHYRAQWYPSEEAHKVIWIAPFLKGPAGKPVLEKVYAVIR